jgi:hypothetical protein
VYIHKSIHAYTYSGKYKWDSTIHPQKLAMNLKDHKTKCWKGCGETWTLLMGIKNGATPLGKDLTASYKSKHTHILQPSNSIPWLFSQEKWKYMPTKTLAQEFFQKSYS